MISDINLKRLRSKIYYRHKKYFPDWKFVVKSVPSHVVGLSHCRIEVFSRLRAVVDIDDMTILEAIENSNMNGNDKIILMMNAIVKKIKDELPKVMEND